jgi:hypothetical protein
LGYSLFMLNKENTMTKKAKRAFGYEIGSKAFTNGLKRVPAFDSNLTNVDKDTLKGWLRGWDEACIARMMEVR